MAKSLRSNNKKALRTVRRKTLAKDPKWQVAAEQERLGVMARILAAPQPSAQGEEGQSTINTEDPQTAGDKAAASPSAAGAAASMDLEGGSAAPSQGKASSGGLQLTKKKLMKRRRQQALKSEASWKSGTVSAFHVKSRKLKRRRY